MDDDARGRPFGLSGRSEAIALANYRHVGSLILELERKLSEILSNASSTKDFIDLNGHLASVIRAEMARRLRQSC
jgi:hypothetical protein